MKSEHKYGRLKNVSIPTVRIQGNIIINKYSRYINLYTGTPIPNNRAYIRARGPDPARGCC